MIDGEGSICCSIRRQRKGEGHKQEQWSEWQYRAYLETSNASNELLQRAVDVTGIGYLQLRPISKRGQIRHHSQIWRWLIGSYAAILSLLEQLDLIVKRSQREVMIEICKSRLSHETLRGERFKPPRLPPWTEEEKTLAHKLKELNKKGGIKILANSGD